MQKNTLKTVLLLPAIILISVFLLGNGGYNRPYSSVIANLISCYDADTCSFDIPNWPPIIGRKISVRIAGIDAPEIRGKCEAEKIKAVEAKKAALALLSAAKSITLTDLRRGKYFRIIANVWADNTSLSAHLLALDLARPYFGGTRKSWC
jgi:micrococcal nuclease